MRTLEHGSNRYCKSLVAILAFMQTAILPAIRQLIMFFGLTTTMRTYRSTASVPSDSFKELPTILLGLPGCPINLSANLSSWVIIICRYITTPDPVFALFLEKISKKMKTTNRYGWLLMNCIVSLFCSNTHKFM